MKYFAYHKYLFCLSLIFVFQMKTTRADTSSPYVVDWTTPSQNTYETMPLGNGEVGLNAWIDNQGDLRFFISRIDALDENARILKLGALRFRFGNVDEQRTALFLQCLDTQRGVMEAKFGEGPNEVSLRLWVDANRPVIVLGGARK